MDVLGSPYPLAYNLKWPWLHVRPSTREHEALGWRPRAHDFVAHNDADVVRVVCFGDLMGLSGDRVPNAGRDLAELFRAADLIVGNCESPVTREAKNPRAFYLQRFDMASAYLREALERMAIDARRTVLSIANNHSGDQGARGIAATIERIADLGAAVAGRASEPIVVRTISGRRIGVAAWTQWLNRPVDERVIACAPSALATPWAELRGELALDSLIATPHWEWEFQHFPTSETIAQARSLAAAGVDVIAGHHPHVVQPIAWVGSTVCQFSLGNLMARTLTWPHRLIAVLEVRLLRSTGRIAGYRSHPFAQLDGNIVALAHAPRALRAKMEARLVRLGL
jgi:poly-gamma-glutamate synthesis protein (capsule biosynthesis protein)